jgi:hypothetical protein
VNTTSITVPDDGGLALIDTAKTAVAERPENQLALLAGLPKRVRLYYGDRATGRDWGEENDVTGYVGRSMGPKKIPLLMATRYSMGGGGVLVDCIVRMLVDGRETYCHPLYKAPAWGCREEYGTPLPFIVCRDGEEHARFRTDASRARWLAFMLGFRATK